MAGSQSWLSGRCGKVKRGNYRVKMVRTAFAALVLALTPGIAAGAPWPAKVLHRIVAPFRSNPFLQSKSSPCSFGFAECFLPAAAGKSGIQLAPSIDDSGRKVFLELRASHGGPLAHHWLELETSAGKVTLGFGPATLPFIDAGQISLQDQYGNTERITGMFPLPFLAPPPLNYRYAKAPGVGRSLGKGIELTLAQADDVIRKTRNARFVGPYVPIFHDCRTFACTVQAKAEGRSSLPCYLLFKGYW
jgi:hypothetical protein